MDPAKGAGGLDSSMVTWHADTMEEVDGEEWMNELDDLNSANEDEDWEQEEMEEEQSGAAAAPPSAKQGARKRKAEPADARRRKATLAEGAAIKQFVYIMVI